MVLLFYNAIFTSLEFCLFVNILFIPTLVHIDVVLFKFYVT